MNSLRDKDVYFGPKAQWRALVDKGCIENISCFQEQESTLANNFVFAKNNSKISHQFCFAVNTGKCILDTEKSGVTEAAIAKKDFNFCEDWALKPPV